MIEGLPERIHCLGASGAGMLPLAICLAQAGHIVSAEDDAFDEDGESLLRQVGVSIEQDHSLGSDCAVVYSSAVMAEHPKRKQAEERGILSLRRGECLARLVRGRRLVAIVGSHGKSTTAAMLADLADQAETGASYLVGARFESGKAPGHWSGSDWVIAEVDESDRTIEAFEPELMLVLNADWDHHATYESAEAYREVYRRMAARTAGRIIADESMRADLTGLSIPVDWIESEDPESEASAGEAWQPLSSDGTEYFIRQWGRFNARNARFALGALKAMGHAPPGNWLEFSRLKRRQSGCYASPEIRVIEDYAHHPAEIDTLIRVVRRRGKQLVVVFQPHRYSRTAAMRDELAEALSGADRLYLIEVYAAFEDPVEGGTLGDLRRACEAYPELGVRTVEVEALNEALLAETRNESVILFLGAGRTDVYARRFAAELETRESRWGSLFGALGKAGGYFSKLSRNEPLASKTTLRVGGPAELYFEPETLGELQQTMAICAEQGIPVRMLGRGSNLVVPDEGVEGLVIRLNGQYWRRIEVLDENRLRVGAGLRIKELCGAAARLGLEGFEFLEGIPGNVGGALRMNAGAMGGWTFDVVESVRYLESDGTLVERRAEELDIGYRRCAQLMNAVATDAVLRSRRANHPEAEIRSRIDTYARKRKETQPREPSAGCIFKNPEGDSAGRVIDELGLKGTIVGGAAISGTHGNFIVNRGGASSSDVIELVNLARKLARERKGVELEPEALLYGACWEEVLR